MSELDYKLLSLRRSCALLTRDDIIEGKVPTTPTTASVIGAIQVQEAVKWFHRDRNLPVLAGKGFVFNGLNHDSYVVEYQRREDCPAHYTYESIEPLDRGVADTTPADLLALARERFGPEAVVDLERELVTGLRCAKCATYERRFARLSQVTEDAARCPSCGQVRDPDLAHGFYGHEDYLDVSLAELGLPPYDLVTFRAGVDMQTCVLARDREAALGKLAGQGT